MHSDYVLIIGLVALDVKHKKCYACEIFSCLDWDFLNREISKIYHSGKFTPRRSNPTAI